MKYIPADKLIAEIGKRKYEVFPTGDGKVRDCSTPDQIQSGWLNALKWVCETITSLQHEQPEVDLEKEIEKWFKIVRDDDDCAHIVSLNGSKCDDWKKENYVLNKPSFIDIARHFYELGLNDRKEG